MAEKKGLLAKVFGRQGSSCCSIRIEEVPEGEMLTPDNGCCGRDFLPVSPENAEGRGRGVPPEPRDFQRTLTIEFLYLDLDACTRCRGTGRNLEEALNEVTQVLQATGVQVNLHKIHVQSEEQALALGFVSSPTIRINGRDIQLDVRESRCESCGDLCGEDVDCRIWVYQGKEYTVAPKGMIIEAILKHVYGGEMEAPPEREAPKELPDNLKRFFAAKYR